MASQAMAQALAMPEIIGNILDTLGADQRTLAVAARVDKLWFDLATDVLWKEATCTFLADVPEDRRQIYAAKIQSIQFRWGEGELHHVFRDLRFNKLKEADIGSWHVPQGDTVYLGQYLQPRLERFFYYGGQLPNNTLVHLQATCKHLRTIWLESPGWHLTPETLFEFISGCNSLDTIGLSKGTADLTSDQLILHLAGRQRLTTLRLDRSLEPELVSEIREITSGNPFPALHTLEVIMPMPSSSVVQLIGMLTQLTSIEIPVLDIQNDIFGPIASIQGLRHLMLWFEHVSELPSSQIVSLRSLHNLESLHLRPRAGGLSTSKFFDDDFHQLVSGLSKLKILGFEVQCDLSALSLASLSDKCRVLEEFDMPHSFDIDAFLAGVDPQTPIFPCLKTLDLGGLSSTGLRYRHAHHSKLAILAKQHIPTLETVRLDWNHFNLSALLNEEFAPLSPTFTPASPMIQSSTSF